MTFIVTQNRNGYILPETKRKNTICCWGGGGERDLKFKKQVSVAQRLNFWFIYYIKKCCNGLYIELKSEGCNWERERNGEDRSVIGEGGIREAWKGGRRDIWEGVQSKREGNWEDRGSEEDSSPRGRRRCPSHHSPWGFHSANALSRSPCR